MTPAHIILARLLASKSVRRHDRRAVGRLPLPPLSRDHIESAQAIRRLKYAGVRVIGVSDGVDTAREALRQIIGDVRLVPEDGALTAEMQSPGLAGALQIALVAGARSERCLPVLRFPGLR